MWVNRAAIDSPPKPRLPGAEESAKLAQEARANLATARDLIERCGYHRRDEELSGCARRQTPLRRPATAGVIKLSGRPRID
jgi:hypothetical protein